MRLCVLSFVALVMGCSDFACPDGQERIEGMCVTSPNDEVVDPPPKTQIVELACTNTVSTLGGFMPWELTVDPGPIVSGEPFGASFRAIARFREQFLDIAQWTIPGGVRRVKVAHLQGTVHVRTGVVDAEASDVMLELGERPPPTCRYDARGAEEGPFPLCDPVNDNLDGSNDDCTGLGGDPHPDNSCGRYLEIDVSEDCDPGGRCDELDKLHQCDRNGFCVAGPLQATLQGSSSAYVAEASGSVFFGWDDQSTGAELDQTGGPNDGTWIWPPVEDEAEPGPNSARFEVGDLEVALECTMGVDSQTPFVVMSVDLRGSPVPDYLLIRFPIQQR